MPERCNHTIAYGYEDFYTNPIKISDKDSLVESIKKHWLNWGRNPNAAKFVKETHEALIAKNNKREILSHEVSTFNFCPECGEKIEWD